MRNVLKLHMAMAGLLVFMLGVAARAAVDTRLVYVSNTSDYPEPGKGTLVIDVEAKSDDPALEGVNSFQDAFQLDATFRSQNPTVTFSDEWFPSSDYTTTEDYRNTDGRVRYVYTFYTGGMKTIGTSWVRIVRVTIEYTMTDASGSVSWFDGEPNYYVTNEMDVSVTGVEEPIPPELTDISLPVKLAVFEAKMDELGVTVRWVTETEVNNLGFELYRGSSQTGPFAKLNATLIRGAGTSSSPHTYVYVDQTVEQGKKYWYRLESVSTDGEHEVLGTVSVANESGFATRVPTAFELKQNFPNPFNPTTQITFAVPQASRVELLVLDTAGRIVRTLVNGRLAAGEHTVTWDGRNDSGALLGSGVYFVKMVAGEHVQIRKMMFIK